MNSVGRTAFLSGQVAAHGDRDREAESFDEEPRGLDGLGSAAEEAGNGGVSGGDVTAGAAVCGRGVRVGDVQGGLDADAPLCRSGLFAGG